MLNNMSQSVAQCSADDDQKNEWLSQDPYALLLKSHTRWKKKVNPKTSRDVLNDTV